ncbi:MAG: 50S ribosomal protein L15 [Alphaproteobacteria bacterium]|nr:50S ribosomal protein L15 [Alphaproteobacteria bacterium]
MSMLNEIRENPAARQKPKCLGRGIGSGKGKTSGKGHKGHKARSGGARKLFEGGQMPLYRRLPKRGFHNPFKVSYTLINLDDLQQLVDSGSDLVKGAITIEALRQSGLVRDNLPVKLLSRGELKAKLQLEVHAASAAAKAAFAKAGGTLQLVGA